MITNVVTVLSALSGQADYHFDLPEMIMNLEYRMCRLTCECGFVVYELLGVDPSDDKPTTQDTVTPDIGGEDTEQALAAEIRRVAEALNKPLTDVRIVPCCHPASKNYRYVDD